MTKQFCRVSAFLIVCAPLMVVEAASYRSVKAEALVFVQRENLDSSICYMRLADGRQMDLRGICGKTRRDRTISPLNTSTAKPPLDDDADEAVSNQQPLPAPQPASTIRVSPVQPSAATSIPTTPASSNTLGDGQATSTSAPISVDGSNGGTASQVSPQPAASSQPSPRVIVQSDLKKLEKRDD